MDESKISGWYLKRSGIFDTPCIIPMDKDEVLLNRSHPALKNCIQISRKHACFQKTTEDRWYLKDLESTNGLYVNHLKISPSILHPLQVGDTICFGIAHGESEHVFEFVLCHNLEGSAQHPCALVANEDNSNLPVPINRTDQVSIGIPQSTNENHLRHGADSCGQKNACSHVHIKEETDLTDKIIFPCVGHKIESTVKEEHRDLCSSVDLKKQFVVQNSQSASVNTTTKSIKNVAEIDYHYNHKLFSEDPATSSKIHTLEIHNTTEHTLPSSQGETSEKLSHESEFKLTRTASDVPQQSIHCKNKHTSLTTPSVSNLETGQSVGSDGVSVHRCNQPKLKNVSVMLERCDSLLFGLKSNLNISPRKERQSSSESDDLVLTSRKKYNVISSSDEDSIEESKIVADDNLKDKKLEAENNFVGCSNSPNEEKCLSSLNSSTVLLNDKSIIKEPVDDNFCYSQQDEVIVISDDEEYISSSQNISLDFRTIKSEPIDEFLDVDWGRVFQDDDDCTDMTFTGDKLSHPSTSVTIEICGQDTAIDKVTPCNTKGMLKLEADEEAMTLVSTEHLAKTIVDNKLNNFKHKDDVIDKRPKHIDMLSNEICEQDDEYMLSDEDRYDIPNKLNCVSSQELRSRLQWTDEELEEDEISLQTDNPITIDSENSNHSFSDVDDTSLPDITQGNITRPLNKDQHSVSMTSSMQIASTGTEPKQKQKSVSMLTEPLPMLQRPRSRRGREEWFPDRYNNSTHGESSNLPPVSNVSSVIPPSIHKEKHKEVSEKIYEKNKKKPRENLRQKIMKEMNHRIPIPGGGSAIVRQDTKSSNLHRDTRHEISNSHTLINHKETKIQKNIEYNKRAERIKSRNVDRFASRQSFLTEDVRNSTAISKNRKVKQKNQESTKKHVSSSTSLTNYKIPKKSAETKDLHHHPEALINSEKTVESTLTNSLQDKRTLSRFPDSNKIIDAKQNFAPNSAVTENHVENETVNSSEKKKRRVTFSDKVTSHIINSSESYPRKNSVMDSFANKKAYSDHHVDLNRCTTPGAVLMHKNIPQPPIPAKPITKPTLDDLLLKMLSWNVAWLREHRSCKERGNFSLPPILSYGPRNVQLFYNTYDSYFNTYSSLLLLETWEQLYESWEKCHNIELICVVNLFQNVGNFMTLECQTVLDDRTLKSLPRIDGCLLIMELRTFNDTAVRTFGYVYEYKSDIFRPEAIQNKLLENFPSAKMKNSSLVSFKLKTKQKKISIDLKRKMKFQLLYYLRPMLRKFDALLDLPSSQLMKDILKPRMNTCSFEGPNKKLSVLGCYNESQKTAILGAVDSILKPFQIPQIILIQGPPGTGKTNVLFGIIQQLFQHKNEKVSIKLLVTAPSNAAVDEIGRRLLRDREKIKDSNKKVIKIVRVGIDEHIHNDLKNCSLDSLLKKNLYRQSESEEKDIDEKIQDVKAKINNQVHRIAVLKQQRCFTDVKNLERQLSAYRRDLDRYQLEKSNVRVKCQPNSERAKYNLRNEILRKADVILSTLSSCRQSALETAFDIHKSKTQFTCCIVDEATQCIEPDVLIPLFYKMSKLIMIGDPRQLPATVNSKEAVKHGFQMSLFERIYKYFEENHEYNPVFMLTEQYRMHSEICAFPSMYFYSGKLTTSQRLLSLYDSFPLKPYIIFDLVNGLEVSNASKVNYPEVQFVLTIINCLDNELQNRYTKGIITPYQGQRHVYLEYVKKQISNSFEVNTIDGFQGREKDIIILSCVRAQGGTIGFLADKQRLNVALTRARHSLIICGHLKTLERNTDWKYLIDDARKRNLVFLINSEEQRLNLLQILRK